MQWYLDNHKNKETKKQVNKQTIKNKQKQAMQQANVYM